jgi:hypothetical protein
VSAGLAYAGPEPHLCAEHVVRGNNRAWDHGPGLIQREARSFVQQQQPQLGTHLASIGVVLDFYAGWAPPRVLYTDDRHYLVAHA